MYPTTLYPNWCGIGAKNGGGTFYSWDRPAIFKIFFEFLGFMPIYGHISYLNSELSPGFPWKKKFPDGILKLKL